MWLGGMLDYRWATHRVCLLAAPPWCDVLPPVKWFRITAAWDLLTAGGGGGRVAWELEGLGTWQSVTQPLNSGLELARRACMLHGWSASLTHGLGAAHACCCACAAATLLSDLETNAGAGTSAASLSRNG